MNCFLLVYLFFGVLLFFYEFYCFLIVTYCARPAAIIVLASSVRTMVYYLNYNTSSIDCLSSCSFLFFFSPLFIVATAVSNYDYSHDHRCY